MTSAASAAAFAGSSYLGQTTQCEKKEEKKKDDNSSTVIGLLHGLTASVQRMEATLGNSNASIGSSKKKRGIDVVLGAQWGDEGKGKLVDMLSQVSFR
jgi:adenylosuccinate synthase